MGVAFLETSPAGSDLAIQLSVISMSHGGTDRQGRPDATVREIALALRHTRRETRESTRLVYCVRWLSNTRTL